MSALIAFLIFALLVCLVAVVVIWVMQTVLAMLDVPANVLTVARMIIILIALLVIVNRALPLIGAYT